MTFSLAPTLAGFAFGLSLIVAIGAQNAFVLRQGIERRHVLAVVAVCAVSDILLIGAGIAGAGFIVDSAPGLLKFAYWGGAAFLICYGLLSARRAYRPTSLTTEHTPDPARIGTAIVTACALTWLNPHVYLDTVVLLGGLGARQPAGLRTAFAAGAGVASAMWFSLLGFGAAAAAPWLQAAHTWRAIDALVALLMGALGLQLLLQPL